MLSVPQEAQTAYLYHVLDSFLSMHKVSTSHVYKVVWIFQRRILPNYLRMKKKFAVHQTMAEFWHSTTQHTQIEFYKFGILREFILIFPAILSDDVSQKESFACKSVFGFILLLCTDDLAGHDSIFMLRINSEYSLTAITVAPNIYQQSVEIEFMLMLIYAVCGNT